MPIFFSNNVLIVLHIHCDILEVMENKNVEQQKKYLMGKLSPRQKEYLEAVDWLYNGGRGTGRTHLICTVALLNILNGADSTLVIDHSPNHEGNKIYTKAILKNLADSIGLKIQIRDYDKFAIYVTRDRTQLMYECVSERFDNDR